MSTKRRATIEDLHRVPEHGKAEIVDGELVRMSSTGEQPGRAAGAIYVSLRAFERQGSGRAYPDNVGFRVDLPNRDSFSPDAAFYRGPRAGMKFLEGALCLPSRSGAKEITVPQLRRKWLANARTTLPREPRSSGTSIF